MTARWLALLTFCTFLIPGITSAQDEKIDSLIQKLNNSQICLDGNYIGAIICLRDEPPLQLYKIGKPVTEKLVSVLDDSTKGIVAHIILSKIWQQGAVLPEVVYNEKHNMSLYKYNNLVFFVNPTEIHASQRDLVQNKYRWQGFLKGIIIPETELQIKFLGQPNGKEIVFQVITKNATDHPLEVTLNRRESYKSWSSDHGVFNYNIELQKFEGNCYSLFGPSADINPVFELENLTELKEGSDIKDTLRLPGYIFSRSGRSPGTFPPGDYRLKVYFRKAWWNALAGESEWVNFSIKQ